jgi:hypothetical protein
MMDVDGWIDSAGFRSGLRTRRRRECARGSSNGVNHWPKQTVLASTTTLVGVACCREWLLTVTPARPRVAKTADSQVIARVNSAHFLVWWKLDMSQASTSPFLCKEERRKRCRLKNERLPECSFKDREVGRPAYFRFIKLGSEK